MNLSAPEFLFRALHARLRSGHLAAGHGPIGYRLVQLAPRRVIRLRQSYETFYFLVEKLHAGLLPEHCCAVFRQILLDQGIVDARHQITTLHLRADIRDPQ